MAYDPYGYQTDEPEPDSTGGALAAFLTLLYGACGLCCTGGALGITSYSTEPLHDKIGVFTLLSGPAWIGFAAAFMTVAMWLATRRTWPSLGPSLVIGGVLGTGLWMASFLAAIVNTLIVEGPQ